LPRFPFQAAHRSDQPLAFDMDDDGRDDYWQEVNEQGQKIALHFDDNADGEPDTTVRLDTPPPPDALHVVIILDGVPFDLVQQLYSQGRLRLFPPPSRMISVFPVMTDLALAKAFGAAPCLGYEALYYDARRERLSDGNNVYLSGRNAPWTAQMDYRCNAKWDALTYLRPPAVWRHELKGFEETLASASTGTVFLYSVGTAGLGTRGGAAAISGYLRTVDALCEEVTHQRRGKVRFTLLADHGQGLTRCRRISFKALLEKAGFQERKTLRDGRDVVIPQYGLVTCAAVHTRSPEDVAGVLLEHEGTDLVMYRAGAWPTWRPRPLVELVAAGSGPDGGPSPVVVRDAGGQAEIRRQGDRYFYRPVRGDPLRLLPVMERLRAAGKLGPDGGAADRDWLRATAEHHYPDPLHRICCAFEEGCLVENPADVLVSLKEGYASGSRFFSSLITIASTHGALSRTNSTTFVLSNAVQAPAVLRVDDLPELIGTGQPAVETPLPARAPAG